MNRDDVEINCSRNLYRGFFHMKKYGLRHKKFDGSWSDTISREVFERGAVAAVVPHDPVRDRIVLIEQFRPGPIPAGAQNPWMIEVVAGILEPNDTPENLTMRETFEETGGELTDILPICAFYMAPGSSTEYCHLFCGRIDSTDIGGLHGNPDEREDIRVFQRHPRSLLLESLEAKLTARSRLSLCSGCSLIIKTLGAVGLNPPKAKILDSGASANQTH